ncbi:paeninodin family lasso peptide [Paenibacillus spongiae]|uniref:Paeninodin family lasso peptide n=1 Tax=Paenibacillus spongiae TaxID=2909671 RepID=A0ABY5SG24_9BACL|nr:paeninodin family lasso peptide [Paenibacillus spongiae]UVI31623.1 paeninodin family lasso peptide [Paenibacillus spongiae]
MAKQEWKQPELQTLEVSMTMEGKGTKYVDVITVSDHDVTDTPPIS